MIRRLVIAFTLPLGVFTFSYGQSKTSLKEQAQKFVAKLKSTHVYPTGGKDTLIDVNEDHFKDILIEFYGMAGTGEKNAVSVYLYDHSKKKFVHCDQLSRLANPTFHFWKKIVTGYYIGNGGGSATRLKWKGLELDTLEHIDVAANRQQQNRIFKLVCFNYVTKKRTFRTLPAMRLPKEYNFGHYQPLITGGRTDL